MELLAISIQCLLYSKIMVVIPKLHIFGHTVSEINMDFQLMPITWSLSCLMTCTPRTGAWSWDGAQSN